jgi:phosphoribosylaminoimidazole-succinocarboxamide synthase
MRVRRFQIFERLKPDSKGCMVPLEFILRHYVAGSFYDRLRNGEVDPKSLGFDSNENLYGKKLPQPFFEVTTKFEKFDRQLDLNEALEISGLSKDEYREIEETVLRLDERIGSEVKKRGLIHVDGKKEFGLDEERGIVVVDTFGTADEDRFWDLKSYEDGGCLELSKEFVRQHYRNIKYHDELMRARDEGREEPDIPPLSEDMVKEVSNLYIEMFERITGKVFR